MRVTVESHEKNGTAVSVHSKMESGYDNRLVIIVGKVRRAREARHLLFDTYSAQAHADLDPERTISNHTIAVLAAT